MIRQAHSYLAGAISGTALIAMAVVACVVLVSAQAFKDWPIPGLASGGQEEVSIETAKPAPAGSAPAASATQVPNAGSTAGTQGPAGGSGSSQSTAIAEQESPGVPAPSGQGGSTKPDSGGGSSPAPSSPSPNSTAGAGSQPGQSKTETRSPSAAATETVDEVVEQVDGAVGGALEETGVPQATRGITNGLAGPTSPAGRLLDDTATTVEGLLGHDN